MPEYCFYKKGNQIVALRKSDIKGATLLTRQGFEKQFEEVSAADEKAALSRFNDIRKEKHIDQHNFRAGAITMPFIGILTAIANLFFRKK
ncbi:hypothetical protein [Enterobacter cancerogenus]|uniref:hypothetical protein n=1 Tax=Enterobacter cancerogenus TaxID=69218 RepID=UPI0005369628|nr:hypothetical protein [Enterobacter cancerogenus]KGT91200.1 hypothetical protein NH00_09100 [Enterobacter cancerogenus]